jgi:hypothetical protein
MRSPLENRTVILGRLEVAHEAGLIGFDETSQLIDDIVDGKPLAPIVARLDEVAQCASR